MYRIVFVIEGLDEESTLQENNNIFSPKQFLQTNQMEQSVAKFESNDTKTAGNEEMNISSTASSSSNSSSTNFNHKISDFKASLKERKTPRSL